jgi:hypothetical protein
LIVTLEIILREFDQFIDAFAGAPNGEAPGGIHIGSAGIVIINLPCEQFQDALCGFWCWR